MWKFLETYIAPPLGLVVLCAGLYVVYLMYASTSISADWPKTKAVIKSTGVAAEKVSVYSGVGEDRGASGYQTMYSPTIIFEYEVKGQAYTGSKFKLATTRYASSDEVEQLLESYKVGEVIEISFNPEDPVESVVIAGSGGIGITYFILISSAILLMIFFTVRHIGKTYVGS